MALDHGERKIHYYLNKSGENLGVLDPNKVAIKSLDCENMVKEREMWGRGRVLQKKNIA